MSLRGLRTFCVAAEQQSFRDAADKLFVTASAVSHQIKKLEQELGQSLFDRDGSSLTLTDAGTSLYRGINPVIARLDEVVSQHKKSVSRTTLRISVQPFFASELFVPRLAEFTAANPGIDIKVDTSDESIEKHPGNVDASIRVFKSEPKNLSSDHLFPLNLIPASSSEFRDTLTVKAKKVVSEFPRIVHESRPKAWTQWQRSAGIELPEEATSVRLDSMIAVVRAAQRGLGAALVPARLCGTMFGSGSLVPLFEHELATADAFYFACGDEDTRNENVQMLRDWVVRTFATSR
jgi:LysR family glycine cleavage system transcriptional activator